VVPKVSDPLDAEESKLRQLPAESDVVKGAEGVEAERPEAFVAFSASRAERRFVVL
jgi:hypothetical protein